MAVSFPRRRGALTVTHRGRRGARPARREEGEYREYLTDEQRRGTGCIGGLMQTKFRDTTRAAFERNHVVRRPIAVVLELAQHVLGGAEVERTNAT